MNRKQLLKAGAAAGAASLVGAEAASAQSDQGVVGSWFSTVDAGALGSFKSLMSFHDGGVFTESRRYLVKPTPLGDLLETSGHGAWERTGNRAYEVFFRFVIQNAETGVVLGTDNVRLALTLEGDALSGTFVSQIKDNDENVIFAATGTVNGSRITV